MTVMTFRRYVVPLKFPILIQLPLSSVDATYTLATESAILAPSCKKGKIGKLISTSKPKLFPSYYKYLSILDQLLLHFRASKNRSSQILGFLGFPGKEADILLPFLENLPHHATSFNFIA